MAVGGFVPARGNVIVRRYIVLVPVFCVTRILTLLPCFWFFKLRFVARYDRYLGVFVLYTSKRSRRFADHFQGRRGKKNHTHCA